MQFSKKQVAVAVGVALAVVGAPVFAQSSSLIDYTTLATEISDQIGLAITAAATLVGLIMGAKMGWNFVRRMLGK